MEEFHTIRRLPPYVFAQVNELVAEAAAAGRDVIDLSMGNPDIPAPQIVIDALCKAVQAPSAHRYSDSKGVMGLREAKARYYERRFGVSLDPETEIVSTLGSKNAFAGLATAITAPGDIALVPDPSYPIHSFGFVLAGGSTRPLPTEAGDDLFRTAERALRHCVPRPKVMVLNYPSNPTARTADLDFYKEAVAFAKKHELIIVSDLAYAEIYYGDPPPSILEVPGAKDVAVELTSVSKSFSMAGWRIGFAVGNRRVIQALTRVKAYLDYGSFEPIQLAAAVALDEAETIAEEMREIYRGRLDAAMTALQDVGWDVPRPEASMFLWARLPEGQGDNSLEFCKRMVREAGVALSPGTGFGEGGEGHVRIALVTDEAKLAEAVRRLGKATGLRQAA